MDYTMRRIRQQLPEEEARRILHGGSNGVLSLVGADGLPYGVPLSFAYDGEGAIYFHSAARGRKIDCIGASGECSFCVIDSDCVVPEEFTTYFRSVIVQGTISVVGSREETLKGLELLCRKYSPGIDSAAEIARCLPRVAVLRLDIVAVTGKEAIELTRRRPQ